MMNFKNSSELFKFEATIGKRTGDPKKCTPPRAGPKLNATCLLTLSLLLL